MNSHHFTFLVSRTVNIGNVFDNLLLYEGWNFNSGNYLFTTDTK